MSFVIAKFGSVVTSIQLGVERFGLPSPVAAIVTVPVTAVAKVLGSDNNGCEDFGGY